MYRTSMYVSGSAQWSAIGSLIVKGRFPASCMCSDNLCMNSCVTHFWKVQLKYYRLPPPPSSRNFVSTAYFSVIAADLKLQLHGKRCKFTFFFNIYRSAVKPHSRGETTLLAPPQVFSLVDNDEKGHPIKLHPGLGNLPLHPEQDGWYSVLGSWNGATDSPNPANQASEATPENNHTIPAPAMNPPRNDHSSLPRIFCQYHKCSSNMLAIPFCSEL